MGLFKKGKKTDIEKAIEYIEEEYLKQSAEFEKQLNKLNAEVDKHTEELDKKITNLESKINEGFTRIESHFDRNINTENQDRIQMQNAVNEYYRQNPPTEAEKQEAEEYLRQLMQNNTGRSR